MIKDEVNRWFQRLIDARDFSGLSRSVGKKAVRIATIKAGGAVLAFGANFVLARYLGAEEYGVYAYIYNCLLVVVLIGKLGLDEGLQRFLPEFRSDGRSKEVRGIIRLSLTIGTIATLLVAIATAVIGGAFDVLGGRTVSLYWVSILLALLLAILQIGRSILQAWKESALALIPELIVKHGGVIVGLVLAGAVFSIQLSALDAIVVTVLAVLLALVFTVFFSLKTLPKRIFRGPAAYSGAEWLRVVAPMFILSGMSVLLNRTDVIVIGSLLEPEGAGIYNIASNLAAVVGFGLQAMLFIVTPVISELYYSGRIDELKQLVGDATKVVTFIGAILAILLGVGGRPVLGLFGEEFVRGYPVLLVLMTAQLVSAATACVVSLLTMTGNQQVAASILVGAAVVNILLNIALVPVLGLIGGAVATSIVMIGFNVLLAIVVDERLAINATVLPDRILRVLK